MCYTEGHTQPELAKNEAGSRKTELRIVQKYFTVIQGNTKHEFRWLHSVLDATLTQ